MTRNGRWTSPKYLIGESYGTTRVAGLAAELQGSQWMFLNGVVLVSPTELGIKREGPIEQALYLPYYAATAWYHKALAGDLQARELEQFLPEVEAFTLDKLIPAIARGGSLDDARRKELVAQYSRYSGLKAEVVANYHFAVPTSFFWKELLRDRGLTVGRLDSRYRGLDREDAGTSPDYDPALSSWNHAFAPAINYYLRDVLKYKTDLQYWLFGPCIRGTTQASGPGKRCAPPWRKTPTCTCWCSRAISTAVAITSMPSTRCGTWILRAASRIA